MKLGKYFGITIAIANIVLSAYLREFSGMFGWIVATFLFIQVLENEKEKGNLVERRQNDDAEDRMGE